MSDDASNTTNPRRHLRFSLGSLLLMVTVVCLSIALVLVYGKLARTERALDALQPISVEEVARQFEENTRLGALTTRVDDVRYSPTENAFRVEFSWDDKKNNTSWSTDVKLEPDGFGRYYGRIRSGEFLKAVGSTSEFYVVGVETPSPLKGN